MEMKNQELADGPKILHKWKGIYNNTNTYKTYKHKISLNKM